MLPFVIGGEILFWIFLLGGLSVRYLLGWWWISTILLIATPLVDIAIIVLTYIDLAGGAPSDFSHGLAAFYVGFSIVFGPDAIRRLDRRFAQKHTKLSSDEVPAVPQRSALADWIRCLVASAITVALLVVGIGVAGWADSFWMIYWLIVVLFTVLVWALIGPLRERFRRRKVRTSR